MSSLETIEQIAWTLHRPGFDSAFVVVEDGVHFARFPAGVKAPSSAVVKLVQAMWERWGEAGHRLYRRRLWTTAELSEMDTGMVKVAAKSVTGSVRGRDHGLAVGETRPLAGDEVLIPDFQMEDGDRDVEARLFDREGRELFRARNRHGRNRTLHAEVNLLQGWFRATGGLLPEGASIEVTHKPCRMCASMILHCLEKPALSKVIYDIGEDGCRSRMTPLDRAGIQFQRGR